MRLQLIVQRHCLPPVYILWTVEALRPPYAAAGSTATVSQLLEQINEIIPLESEDWGLEDYTVEVRGFECLHFSELSQVLREDDEVSIRPLQTSDLRFRKLSGRHQISVGGKHLIDGVAFGRPFLHRTDRPPVRIPPRKRRRVTYTEYSDNDVDEDANSLQVIALDDDLSGEDSEDEDYSVRGDEKDELSTELEDLHNDIYNDTNEEAVSPTHDKERTVDLDGVEEPPLGRHRSRKSRKGLGLNGTSMLELLDENGRPYPGEYNNPLLDFYDQDEPSQKADKSTRTQPLRKRTSLRNRMADVDVGDSSGNPGRLSRRSSSASVKGVRFEDIDSATPITIREFEISHQSNDGGFEPDSNMDIEIGESDKENSQPQQEDDKKSMSLGTSSESTSSFSYESESVDDETSSSGPSSSSTSSESEPERLSSTLEAHAETRKTLSKASSSSASSKLEAKKWRLGYIEAFSRERRASKGLTTQSQTGLIGFHPKPPFEGKPQTQKRNRRRRDSQKLLRLKSLGILPPDATLLNIRELRETGGNQEMEEKVEHESKGDPQTPIDFALSARKDSLLESIASDPRGLTQKSSKNESTAKSDSRFPITKTKEVEPEASTYLLVNRDAEKTEDVQPTVSDELLSGEPDNAIQKAKTPELIKRRSKLDLSSSRRLLFGSLGLRTPKTKDEEDNIRAKLMKDIKPMQEPKSPKNAESSETPTVPAIEDDDSWRDKITLKAVECCHDGIELSTPPFPFVQRWDPQQQKPYQNSRSRKAQSRSKKRKRNDDIYSLQKCKHKTDDEVIRWHEPAQYEIESSFNEENSEQSTRERELMTSRRDSDDCDAAISEQLMRETEASTGASVDVDVAQDLQSLPEDMSVFHPLAEDAVKPGAVIAFKQLDMSEATSWQPKISDYRTALVNCLTDDGLIRMALAKRDQPQKGGLYDETTGERMWSKFEMPGFDDDDAQNMRDVEISFSELIQPKLIQAAEPGSTQEVAHYSVRGGDNLSEDADIIMGNNTESPLINANIPNQGLPSGTFDQDTINGAGESVRQEIFDLIKDAGWRSTLCSDNAEKPMIEPKSVSPTFNGFGSSPPFNKSTAEEMAEPVTPKGVNTDTLPASQQNKTFEIAESLPAQRITIPNSPLQNSCYGEDIDVKDEDVNEHSLWSKPQHMSDVAEEDDQKLPQEFPSETSLHQSEPHPIESKGRDIQPLTNASALGLDGPSSDNEFPTLENVFSQIRSSQARSSFEPSLPAGEDLSYMEQSSFESTKPKRAKTRKIHEEKSKFDGTETVSQKSTLFKWEESEIEEEQRTPRASQAPIQSQIVDLTISSDPIYPADPSDDSDYVDDGTQLPSGPGWIKKNRSSLGRFDAFKAGSGRSSRSRSTGAY